MTYRELLESLKQLDEKQLDMKVRVFVENDKDINNTCGDDEWESPIMDENNEVKTNIELKVAEGEIFAIQDFTNDMNFVYSGSEDLESDKYEFLRKEKVGQAGEPYLLIDNDAA